MEHPKEVNDMLTKMNNLNCAKLGKWKLGPVTIRKELNYEVACCWMKQENTNIDKHHTVKIF